MAQTIGPFMRVESSLGRHTTVLSGAHQGKRPTQHRCGGGRVRVENSAAALCDRRVRRGSRALRLRRPRLGVPIARRRAVLVPFAVVVPVPVASWWVARHVGCAAADE